ncbi:MAG: DUF4159 domain-containing protein [Planctomycetes bacterium]|nr:DUF4159 domain-containing protein [Planctomycetota bacterium]
MRNVTLPLIAVAVLLLASSLALGQEPSVTDADVDRAIQRGVDYLLGLAQPDGKFSPDGNFMWVNYAYPFGHEAIIMCALAHAEVSLNDERMRKGFDFLLRCELEHTYTRSCRVITIARLLPKLKREERDTALKVMKADMDWLLSKQIADGRDAGMWSYPVKPNYNVDFSNTQLAVLAMNEYEMAGGEIDDSYYEKSLKPFLERQKPSGGWNYGWVNPEHINEPERNTMTAVGVASLFIIRDRLFSLGCPCKGGKSGPRPKKIDEAIEHGIGWLAANPGAERGQGYNRYFHYACARVGLAAGLKYFGTYDWYRQGAAQVISMQHGDGSWSDFGSSYRTCFAIMFLVKGRAPILVNKLQFKGDWDRHPRDAANLAAYVGKVKEQKINWQVINLDAPVPEWHEAPILYISAETPIELTDEQKQKLRRYTDTGGTILFEASCGNKAVSTWWVKTCGEIWPEWELKKIDKDHLMWSADQKLVGRLPVLQGISDGVRTFVFYSPSDISCAWNTQAIARNELLFKMGINLYAYTTDHGKLRSKLAGYGVAESARYGGATVSPGGRTKLRMRLLKHGGDWYVTRHYGGLGILGEYLAAHGQITCEKGEPIEATDAALAETDVLWLTGRKGLSLAAAQQAALKTWLSSGGGFLVVDACMGDKTFDAAWKQTATELGLTLKALPTDAPLMTGGMGGTGGYNLTKCEFDHALRAERIGKNEAALHGLYLGEKLVGVYSEFDVLLALTGVKAYDRRGYEAADARAVATNMILPATLQGGDRAAPAD